MFLFRGTQGWQEKLQVSVRDSFSHNIQLMDEVVCKVIHFVILRSIV